MYGGKGGYGNGWWGSGGGGNRSSVHGFCCLPHTRRDAAGGRFGWRRPQCWQAFSNSQYGGFGRRDVTRGGSLPRPRSKTNGMQLTASRSRDKSSPRPPPAPDRGVRGFFGCPFFFPLLPPCHSLSRFLPL